ncbi:hypothetical protein ACUXDX_001683 [Staphylococcus epidermidis]|uniref:hypothetical protein n=1 Tax=Staphylococcus epidermidis TaxID=1282 RepID=UPI0019328823|nr:hypothetical protein [Staphylococcus epidermidis]MBM0752542.1 hypothetical protein [Staphylococcus epidermidis]MBM0765240.1 hypothetical protein [Staphylococcus epidermidis]MBM0789515.1 hypothetical protein [Staphylococcus epidermidis]MCG1605521.1 hypothetical protein [Staphylococcus epidermidis]
MENELKTLHETIRNDLKQKKFRNKVKSEHEALGNIFNPLISTPEFRNINIESKEELKELTDDQKTLFCYRVLKEVFSDYYFTRGLFEKNSLDLIGKDFDVAARIRLSNHKMNNESPNLFIKKMFAEFDFMIELVNIDSFKKDAGLKLIKKLKEVSAKTYIPIWLYDLNTKDKKYFENLGFKLQGKYGLNNEPLRIYFSK